MRLSVVIPTWLGTWIIELDLLAIEIIGRHAPNIDPAAVKTRPSKDGNFMSVTVIIEAASKRDSIHHAAQSRLPGNLPVNRH